jgi:hypothetical protein
VILDRFDVGMDRAIRQRSAKTTWLGRAQDCTLQGKLRLLPAGTYSSTWRVELKMYFSGCNDKHLCWNSSAASTGQAGIQAAANSARRKKEYIILA